MHPKNIPELEELTLNRLMAKDWFQDSILPFLILSAILLLAGLMLTRYLMQASDRLTGDRCDACGGTMKRIHQLWWLRFFAPAIPFMTYYCSPCRKKRIRVKPAQTFTRRQRQRS